MNRKASTNSERDVQMRFRRKYGGATRVAPTATVDRDFVGDRLSPRFWSVPRKARHDGKMVRWRK